VRRLREEAAGEPGTKEVPRRVVRDFAAKPRLERRRVQLVRVRMRPRRLRVELLREPVEHRIGLVVGGLGDVVDGLVSRVPVRSAVPVDVHALPVAVRGKELDPELAQERVEPRLVRRDPFAAELVRLAAELRVP
jgi:hypothetical protein